jgi:hypothetical protein
MYRQIPGMSDNCDHVTSMFDWHVVGTLITVCARLCLRSMRGSKIDSDWLVRTPRVRFFSLDRSSFSKELVA